MGWFKIHDEYLIEIVKKKKKKVPSSIINFIIQVLISVESFLEFLQPFFFLSSSHIRNMYNNDEIWHKNSKKINDLKQHR